MSSFICTDCGESIVDTDDGYITGCEHYPLEVKTTSNRRTSFLELLIKHQANKNIVTQSVYKEIICKRVANFDYT